MLRYTIFITIAVLTTAITHPREIAPRALKHRLRRSGNDAALTSAPSSKPRAALRVVPSSFGGDPTGRADSWRALQDCVDACVNASRTLDPLGRFPGDTSFGNGKSIRNAGGCFVDLVGGEYKISRPLVFPEYVGNIHLGFGSLVASDAFSGGDTSFLIVIGERGSCKVPQGSCNVDINFPSLFLDGRHLASAMQINNVMGVTIGPGGYFLNFTEYGVQINAGHEVMIDRCWLGETNFDFDHEKLGRRPNATAIQINGNDHYVLNTVVFSSKIGLEVNGAADYVEGVHVWFPDNHAVAFADTMAFHVTGSNNRFAGCYIDGGRAVFEGNALRANIWERGFECCQNGDAAPGTASSGIILAGNTLGPGLQIVNSEFQTGSIFHQTDDGDDDDVSIVGVRIAHNSMAAGAKSTIASKTMVASDVAISQWTFDFCDVLLFPQIATVKVHFAAADGFPVAIARPPIGCNVTVETNIPAKGTMTVDVDSSKPSGTFG